MTRATAPLRILLVLGACAFAGACSPQPVEEVATSAAVPVVVAPATVKTIAGIVSATAIVTPAPGAQFDVTAPETARIVEMPRAEGDRVARGDLLVRFDVPALAATVTQHRSEASQARARVEQARASADRMAGLFERGVASRKDVEDARRELVDAEGAVVQAESATSAAATLASRATVHAPFSGIVSSRRHNPGDLVEPAAVDPILRVIDPARLQLVAAVPLADLTRVRPGCTVRVIDPGGKPAEPGTVVSLPAEVEPASATAEVRIAFTSPTRLTAGSPVQVEIVTEQHPNALTVPSDALVREGADVFVVLAGADHKAHRRLVTLGLQSGGDAEIRSGLSAGDRVIIRGQGALPDGAAVSVAP